MSQLCDFTPFQPVRPDGHCDRCHFQPVAVQPAPLEGQPSRELCEVCYCAPVGQSGPAGPLIAWGINHLKAEVRRFAGGLVDQVWLQHTGDGPRSPITPLDYAQGERTAIVAELRNMPKLRPPGGGEAETDG